MTGAPTIISTDTTQLAINWRNVEWEGLRIPIPPRAQWEAPIKVDPSIGDVPVLAAGAVTYPTITGTVELPFGPVFMILQFSGSLDDWIDHELRRNELAVDRQTVRDTTIAGRPAKVYQPVVIGTCNLGAYVVTLDTNRLLLISTECLGHEPFDSVIKGLQISAPTR
jgi:hypothetical protein